MPSLRERLTEMTEGSASRHLHVQEVEEIRKQYPHNITVVEEGPREDTPDWEFNCYMYALGVHRDEEVISEIKTTTSRMDFRFVMRLLNQPFVQEISKEEAKDGDVVIYREEREGQSLTPRHAGVREGELVISKWGDGHIWRHPLLEVPSIYGNVVKFYRRPSEDDIKRTFLNF